MSSIFPLLLLVLPLASGILKAAAQSTSGQPFPSQQTIANWAQNLDKQVQQLTTGSGDITKATAFAEAYKDAFDNGVGFSMKHPQGEKILEEMVEKVTAVFDKNIQALKDLHDTAEEAVKNYKYDGALYLNQVNFTNVNDMEGMANMTEYSHHFKQDINNETSGVHVPIEIYEGYNSMQMTKVCPDCTSVCDLCRNNLYWRRDSALGITDAPLVKDPNILNTIAWTQALDLTFKANARRFPGIYWQSFGSQEGVMRVYPATPWQTVDDLPDLFDVRRRPWYIHGTSSPKDVVILLDTSGSMHGQSFDIMKIAAKTLLNTLGENDYVNVAAFSRDVTWVTPCLGDGLVQANARNKRLLFDGIDLLVDRNIASFRQALDFAYRHLESFENTRDEMLDGSDCHKLIMVFSDGGTEDPKKILKVYTNSSRGITSNARIFTYAVGPHPLPTVALKDMACATGGEFTTITAMGAIRTKVQSSYVPTITRPTVLSGVRPVGFSSIYLNAVDYIRILNRPLVLSKYYEFFKSTFFSRDHLGLGFVTTITMPVFNTSLESDNQTLAGVVGIDIPVSRFEAFAPRSQLGPLGYTFGLNTNGFLIFHPNLWMISNYLEDPAHNDLEDIEGSSDEIRQLRKEMIDMAADQVKTGVRKISMTSAVILNLGHSASIEMDYFYAPIVKTSFALAVAIPKFWQYLSVPEQPDAKNVLETMMSDTRVYNLASRKYCDETKADQDADEGDTLEDILEKLGKDACHGRDLNHMIWDYKTLTKTDFRNSFIMADSGLTLTNDGGEKDSFLDVDPYNSSLYKMALLSDTPVLFVEKHADRQIIPIYIHSNQEDEEEENDIETITDEENEDTTTKAPKTTTPPPKLVMQMRPPSIYLAQAIRLQNGQDQTTLGVSGTEVQASFLQDLLINATKESSVMDCQQSSELACYLIDTSGYILTSNQEVSQVGDFLGVSDAQLMAHMMEKEFYQNRSEYNYQALCPTEITCVADSGPALPRLFISSLLDILGQLCFSVYALILSSLAQVQGVNEYTKQVTEGLHRCTTRTQHWEWKGPQNYQGRLDLDCKGIPCVREIHTFKLQHINAVLLVAEPPQKCQFCRPPLIFDGPLEVPTFEDCLLPPRYRRRPEDCFATHDDEVFECSISAASSSQLISLPFLILIGCYQTVHH